MYEHEFTGRAPSGAQIKAHVKKAVAAGYNWIQLYWGENQITLTRAQNPMAQSWHGHGWIRKTGGQDIARELSRGPA